ncbi:hypothetical protein SLITO_v1c06380 [Spiroplasma litorale]|uniref:HTH merR-type domain-containing protein n=2 Tax=Spiroplasma litorale TaxID=216942 RepID=A0A0K1W2G3_9MOLU|nr:hypothetical protein SLITO_v1c06380 [Spiroplasma litorale]
MEIGFSLDDIKIIIDNLSIEDINSIFIYYLQKEKELCIKFELNFNKYIKHNTLEVDRDTFGYFKSESLGKAVMFEMYNYRKLWYENDGLKKEIKLIRNNIFLEFSNYIEKSNIEKLYYCFNEIKTFLRNNINNYNRLHFLCLFKWWTTDPRYVKQIKNRLNYNYGPELFKHSLIWCCQN